MRMEHLPPSKAWRFLLRNYLFQRFFERDYDDWGCNLCKCFHGTFIKDFEVHRIRDLGGIVTTISYLL